jgi:hypothetical protein
MKKIFLFLYSTFYLLSSTFAQSDSVRITHTQETGTLEKQRFIDQYDYVFMTKEPTKWMLKGYAIKTVKANSYDLISSDRITTPVEVAFERKLTPSFSVSLGGIPQVTAGRLVSSKPATEYSEKISSNLTLKAFTELRWYYNLNQRIKEGKSANNFSGNYVSIRIEKNFINPRALFRGYSFSSVNGELITDKIYEAYHSKIGLVYGLQRRFLRNGLIDFSLNLNRVSYFYAHQQIAFKTSSGTSLPLVESYNWEINKRSYWQLNTEMRLGLAIGDFTRSSKQPLCDVLKCYENKKQLWKFTWPSIRLAANEQSVSSSIAFERKILNSSLSMNAQIDGYFFNRTLTPDLVTNASQKLELWSSLQCRYYFLQKYRLAKHGSGSNLSGLYGAFSLFNIRERTSINAQNFYLNSFELGPTLGFQQKIFNRGYIDYHFSFSKSINESRNFPRSISGEFSFRPSFKLGFAL